MFTKEYIKEADCEEIQGLRQGRLYRGDWFIQEGGYPEVMNNDCFLGMGNIWLPTGDQLDEEIVKICKEKEYFYEAIFVPTSKNYCMEVSTLGQHLVNREYDTNPLIAKIKLLKQLKEE